MKDLGMETRPGEGVVKEKFPNRMKSSHMRVFGEFWNLGRQHNWAGKKKKAPQNRRLTATASGEVAQMLTTTTSERGLDREARTASLVLRVRTPA